MEQRIRNIHRFIKNFSQCVHNTRFIRDRIVHNLLSQLFCNINRRIDPQIGKDQILFEFIEKIIIKITVIDQLVNFFRKAAGGLGDSVL